MKPESIVENLIDEPYGPPIPDKWQNVLGSTRSLRDLHRKQDSLMRELEVAVQYRRQLEKLGLTQDQVRGMIRQSHLDQRNDRGSFITRRQSSIPPEAIVGIQTDNGEVMFDFPIIVS